MSTVLGSLGLVLGLFFLFVWFARRNPNSRTSSLPKEAVEILGKASSGPRQHMELVRMGNKLVLLSVTPGGISALSEISDRDEVERLTALCRRGRAGRTALRQLSARVAT